MSISFHRTPSGLSNLAVFLGVDAVVYLEGGDRQYSLAELETDIAASEGYDTMFWETVFSVFRPKLKAHFKSIGSKATVLSVSRLVAAGATRNVITAMDRDLDHARRAKLKHPNILYTRGYSWENDVFTKANLKTVCQRLCLSRTRHKELNSEIEVAFSKFSDAFHIFVNWEHCLARSGVAGCDRETLKTAIELRPPEAPRVSRSRVAKLIHTSRQANPSIRMRGSKAVNVFRDIHGHTIERFCLGFIQFFSGAGLNLKVNNDVSTRLFIGAFEKCLREEGQVSRHYRNSLRSIAA